MHNFKDFAGTVSEKMPTLNFIRSRSSVHLVQTGNAQSLKVIRTYRKTTSPSTIQCCYDLEIKSWLLKKYLRDKFNKHHYHTKFNIFHTHWVQEVFATPGLMAKHPSTNVMSTQAYFYFYLWESKTKNLNRNNTRSAVSVNE